MRDTHRRHGWSDRELLLWVVDEIEEARMALGDLQAAVDDLRGQVQAESQELEAVVAGLQAAAEQIASLQAQIAGGGSVTEADLDALTAAVTDVARGAQAATQAASAAEPDPQNPVPASPPAPAPVSGPAAAPEGEPVAQAASEVPGHFPQVASSDRTLYRHTGLGPVDPTTWPAAPVHSADGAALFHFAGDQAPGDRNGDGVAGEWEVYEGPLAGDQPDEVEPVDEGVVAQQLADAAPGSSPSQVGGAAVAAEGAGISPLGEPQWPAQ